MVQLIFFVRERDKRLLRSDRAQSRLLYDGLWIRKQNSSWYIFSIVGKWPLKVAHNRLLTSCGSGDGNIKSTDANILLLFLRNAFSRHSTIFRHVPSDGYHKPEEVEKR
ncbi:hypothetical protein PoB_005508200 [Plakobranchus ocellatus]|uniref:Uncharacterized protein n=1 Tax=Plakobranchus ocellatus TaxID=259542 RepID=A0AAV4CBG5_9GAST|nr:hypothetical protein PoB_005508200 [Plakobranchus ocellatus]